MSTTEILSTLLRSSPLGICVVEPPTPSIVVANEAMSRIFGMPVTPGISLAAFVATVAPSYPDGRPIPMDALPAVRALRGQTVEQLEMRVSSGNRVIFLLCNAAPIVDPATGTVAAAVDHFLDITRTKELERARDVMADLVSHDVRSPLAAISLHTERLIRQGGKLTNEAVLQSLRAILAAVRRTELLVADLSSIAHIDGGTIRPIPTELDVVAFLTSLVDRIRPMLAPHPVELDIGEMPWPTVMISADAGLLERAISSLLMCAGRRSPGAEQVDVSLSTEPGWCVIRVSDRGAPIPESDRPKVFDLFFPGQTGHQESIRPGPFIARGIALAHGGSVGLECRPSGGNTFAIRLPNP
ncbi:MAG: HAMP domain-containing sensor histidine kinase [Pseudomonadota bacterium]